MKRNYFRTTAPALLAAALISACGGGGGDTPAGASGSERIRFSPQDNSFQAVEGTQNYRLSGTATALTGQVDRSRTGWSVSRNSQISSNEITLQNADCAEAVLQGTNNGEGFRQEQSITCDVSVDLPALTSLQSRRLVLSYGVSDTSGNIATRDFAVEVLNAPGRNPTQPQVSIIGTVSSSSASNASSITVAGAAAITFSSTVDSQFFDVTDVTYSQVAGPDVAITNADCENKNTVNGNVTCQAFMTLPVSASDNEFIVAVRGSDSKGNVASRSYTVRQTAAGGSAVNVALSQAGTFANPLFVAPGSTFDLSCFPSGGTGVKTVRWTTLPLSSTGTIASGQVVGISDATSESISVSAPGNPDQLTYAALCTATDENGLRSPATQPDYTTVSGQNNSNTLFFRMSDTTPAINLTFAGDPQINALTDQSVTLTMTAANSNGSASQPTDFNYQWHVLSPSGTSASFSGTQNQRIARFSTNDAGFYIVEGCANRVSTGQPLSATCSGVQNKVSATVDVRQVTVAANARFNDSTAQFRVIGQSFGVNASGSVSQDGTALRYTWSSTDPSITITNPNSSEALVNVANSAQDNQTLSVTLTVMNTPASGEPVSAIDTLSFRVAQQASGSASIDVGAGANQTIPFQTWSATSSFTLDGSSVVANNASGFTKTVRWFAIPDLTASSFECDPANTPVEIAALNPNPRNAEDTTVAVALADQPARGQNKSYFYLLKGELRDSANAVRAFDCATTTVVLRGQAADINATVQDSSVSLAGVSGQATYNFNVVSTTIAPPGETLRFFWYVDSGSASISTPAASSSDVIITDGPDSVAVIGLIVYTDTQLANMPTDFNNATARNAFIAAHPAQRAFTTLSVTAAP